MLNFLTWLSFLLIAYAYIGYPLCLTFLPRRSRDSRAGDAPRSYSVIVAARNEEAVIAERLENVLTAEIPEGSTVEYLVCSDASDDRTHEIVEGFANRGVKLVISPERKGKEHAQSLAIAASTGEVIVFTDAKVTTETVLLNNLSRYFRDPEVGAVSSIDRVEAGPGGSSGEGMYVRYEMWLRKLESVYSTLVGLSGSCFAVRREFAESMRTDIPSDFALLIQTVKHGSIGVLGPDVICKYKAVKTEEQEFQRKVRTVLRGISTLFAVKEVLNPAEYGSFAWQILSHKLGRWAVPWLLLFGTFGALLLAPTSVWWTVVFIGLVAFYGAAIYGFYNQEARSNPLIKIPLFFLTTNAAIFVSWIKFIQGTKSVTWNPSVR